MAGITTRGINRNGVGVRGVDSNGFWRLVTITATMSIPAPIRTANDTTKRVIWRVTNPLFRTA